MKDGISPSSSRWLSRASRKTTRTRGKQPIVSFGLITDIHYADHDDCWNYTKTQLRRYRNAANLVNEACQHWTNAKYPISFILQLGDLIDGVAAKGQASQRDLETILGQFRKTFPELKIYHLWGNHELY